MKKNNLVPPDPIPALSDPAFGNEPGPYSVSNLRDVVGTRINPDAYCWYKRREVLKNSFAPKSCAHPDLEGWLADVQGFDPRSRLEQPLPSKWPLSSIIPRMALWGEKLPFEMPSGTFMIDYMNLHSSPFTTVDKEWVNHVKDRFPDGSNLLLSFFGPEGGEGSRGRRPLILGLWTLPVCWYSHFLDQFDGIILPDLSVYSND